MLEKGVSKGKRYDPVLMVSVQELRKALQAFPQYEETKHKASVHFHLADLCLTLFKKQNLKAVAELEQAMANDEGKPPNEVSDYVLNT